MMIERGAKIDSVNQVSLTRMLSLVQCYSILKEKSPFVMACEGGHSELALYLLNNGVSVETDPPSVLVRYQ